MKGLAVVCVAVLGVAGACLPAAAGPAVTGPGATAPAGGIVLVDGGCGPGGFRDYYGYCRPKRIYAPPPPPRRFYGCPYGFRPTPYGCRPLY